MVSIRHKQNEWSVVFGFDGIRTDQGSMMMFSVENLNYASLTHQLPAKRDTAVRLECVQCCGTNLTHARLAYTSTDNNSFDTVVLVGGKTEAAMLLYAVLLLTCACLAHQ